MFRKLLIFLLLVFLVSCNSTSNEQLEQSVQKPSPWPPVVGQKYPNLKLRNSSGQNVELASFAGKVLIIEPIGMPCQACQAFSGGAVLGGFKGVTPQKNLESFEVYFPRYSQGVTLESTDIVFIQILFYSMQLGVPTLDDAKRWEEHFQLKKPNVHVLIADSSMHDRVSYNMIPGFQLINRDFVLIKDASGHNPTHNAYTDLIPEAARIALKKS